MSAAPSVSVVLPTRDRPELLARAVAAVLAQDYAGDVECLVVHDGTPTEPVRLPPQAQALLDGRRRSVRVLANERSPGLAGTRNTGYLAAAGELLANCDDDDEWLPGKLAAQVHLLRREPAASVVSCGILVHYEGRDTPRCGDGGPLELADLLRDRHMEVHPSTYLVRRADVLGTAVDGSSGGTDSGTGSGGIGLVDEALPGGYAEDYEWLLRAARRGPVVRVPEPLVRVLWHRQSFFADRWATIEAALTHLLASVPEFAGAPVGRARIEGQIAFAHAALGHRRAGLRHAGRALRRHPGARQAWASLAVTSGVVSADRVLALGRRAGRGI